MCIVEHAVSYQNLNDEFLKRRGSLVLFQDPSGLFNGIFYQSIVVQKRLSRKWPRDFGESNGLHQC